MEFFFPADVFSAYPRQGPSNRATSFGAGPSTNVFNGCGFDSHPLFVDALTDAIQQERAAHARAHAQRAARAEAARRAKAAALAAAAARREAEERRAQAYIEHLLAVQQREAQRRYHLEQLHRQRQEAQRRQQYEEYQRRKAYAIEKERQRIAAAKAAEDQSEPLFLALEDLILGGLNGFFRSLQRDQDDEEDHDDHVELAHKNDTQHQTTALPGATQAPTIDVKGKGKAQDNDNEQPMEVDNADKTEAAAPMETDQDPEEVGPLPTTPTTETAATPAPSAAPAVHTPAKTEQVVFSHTFPADASFDKTTVRADQINVSVDEAQRKVTVSGLWNDQPTISADASPARSASPTPSDSSSRRGRSRSPKRARVSDVDENGEEIVKPEADENEDDFVEISFNRAEEKVQKAFDLPEGANVEDLRAELTDEGLKLFTTVSA
ncbi:hypothetical protein PSEUBRA_000091 [Kalmanozyma brasiliensis GHG001]|uniref:SHSP domain-containing protein n=1 Tax=Kalmanozyma brasiliensis (strain GHG001) TaxID=1365824 RepID=V5EGP2_KALBG|nr:uncharacterized protein PSEUBRA_000091 [Kalmanozyma brasiliensis GHG001]EST09716.1 hypothetical protein PSEUBRA_000091 [Kalmanozyma brasiliensis GHG001]